MFALSLFQRYSQLKNLVVWAKVKYRYTNKSLYMISYLMAIAMFTLSLTILQTKYAVLDF